LYQWMKHQTNILQPKISWGLVGTILPWVLFAAIYFLMGESGFDEWANALTKPYHSALRYSKGFVHDIFLAIAFAGCLLLYWRRGACGSSKTHWLATAIYKLAPLTFAVYALHYPLLKFIAESPNKSSSIFINVLLVLLVFSISAAIGLLLEPTRKIWQRCILATLDKSRL
jgi:hypothetical protein